MAAPTCTLDSLNINDGSTYTIESFTPDAKVASFDEYRSYDGSVAQYNETTANLVQCSLTMLVQAATAALLRTALAALNTKVEAATFAAPKSLVYASTTYYIVTSSSITWVEDARFLAGFNTVIDFTLNRKP